MTANVFWVTTQVKKQKIGELQEALELLVRGGETSPLDTLDLGVVHLDAACSDSEPEEQHLGDITSHPRL